MSSVKDHEPYDPNFDGLIGVLIDLKKTIADRDNYAVAGFTAPAFENITQGEAVYSRASDGKVGKAIANDTVDKASGRIINAGYKSVMKMLKEGDGNNGYLDGLILSSTSIPIPKVLQKKFLNDVYTELNQHVKNFNPEQNDNLFAWIGSQIKNKTLNVQKTPEYSPDILSRAKDIEEKTEEGAPRYQPAANNEALDNFIDNIGATEVDQELTSELRQDINLTPEMMDKVRDAVINTFKNNLPNFNSPEFKRELKKQYIIFLSDQIKKYMGSKRTCY